MSQRDGAVLVVGEEAKRFVELRAVRVRVVLARVKLEGADGKEGFKGRVAVAFRVEDRDELLVLGGR